MSAPDKSNLDGMQVLSHSFDDNTGEIRVQASVTANISQTEVIIDAANDSIKIGDGTDFLAINPDGSINVVATVSGATTTQYDEGDIVATPTGTAILAQRSDNSLYVPQVNNNNQLEIEIINTTGAGAVNIQDGGNSITVDGSVSATQSGTWNINNISGTISLPTGAATSSNQTSGSQKTQIVDGSGNVIGSTSNAIDVNIKSSSITLEVNLDNANDDVLIYGFDGATNRAVKTDSSGTVSINDGGNSITVDNSGTFAVQATQSTSPWVDNITQLGGNSINLGSGASSTGTQRVILATDQPVIPVSDNGGSITVDGSVTVTQATGTNLHTVIDSGTITTITNVVHVDDNGSSITVDGTVAATQSGTWNINNISGTVSLPTGASTLAEQQTQTTSLQLIDDTVYTDGTGTPSKGLAVMGTDGTNPQIISTNVSGHVNIADGGNSITVDNAGTFAVQATVAAGASNIGKAEDVASADADVGVPAMAIRKATPANTSGTDGDYEMLQMSAGRLWTSATIDSALPAGSNVIGHVITDSGSTTVVTGNVTVVQPTGTNLHTVLDSGTLSTITNVVHVDDNSGSLTVDNAGTFAVQAAQSGTWTSTVTQGTASNLNAQVVGNVASAATDSGNPVKIGGTFNTTQPTVTNGQRVDAQMTARGAQIVSTGTDTFNVTVNAALPAGSNVIGHVITDSGSTTVVTGNVTVVQPTGTNLHTVVDSGTVTANAGTNLNTSALNLESTQSAMSAKLPATLGQKAMAASLAVVIASDQTTFPVTSTTAVTASATLANVSSSATSVTLIASNASRKMATIFNDSTAYLYVKFGTTASTTSFNVKMNPGAYFEFPLPMYTGRVDGIWSAANGSARTMEL